MKQLNKYNWLEIFAEKWLHEYIWEYIKNNFKKDINIIILWSWSWALDSRLYDLWYCNITSVDINKDWYLYKNEKINFLNIDLNKTFSNLIYGKYDLVLSVEIIEHIYSPFNFLKESHKLLTSNWYLFITTPNIHSDKSRLNHLLFWFPKSFYWTPEWDAHISILTKWILEFLWNKNWLQLDKYFSILDNNKFFWYSTKLYLKMRDIIFWNKKIFEVLLNKEIFSLRKWDIAIYLFKNKDGK